MKEALLDLCLTLTIIVPLLSLGVLFIRYNPFL
jgi:hypothetical protein